MKMLPVLVATWVTLLAAGCSTESQPSFADDLAAITGFNERYLASINNEDIAALSALTTEGHIMLPPNQEPVVGKSANGCHNCHKQAADPECPASRTLHGNLPFSPICCAKPTRFLPASSQARSWTARPD